MSDAWHTSQTKTPQRMMDITPQHDSSSIDTMIRAVADEQRRLILQHLKEVSDGTASAEELAEYITTHSADETSPDKVAIRLHHAHLPTLADAHIIEYDSQSRTVHYQPSPLVEGVLASISDAIGGPPND